MPEKTIWWFNTFICALKIVTVFELVLNIEKKNKLQDDFVVFDVLLRNIKMHMSVTINYTS